MTRFSDFIKELETMYYTRLKFLFLYTPQLEAFMQRSCQNPVDLATVAMLNEDTCILSPWVVNSKKCMLQRLRQDGTSIYPFA